MTAPREHIVAVLVRSGVWPLAVAERAADALLAAGIGTQPEATEFEEWGVRWDDGQITKCGWMTGVSEEFARSAGKSDEGRLVNWRRKVSAVLRRTRTTYADKVTDWSEVESDV